MGAACLASALLGLASHYAILFVAAGFYAVASRRLPVLRSQAVIGGALYGVLIYLFMNFVVIKLSACPFRIAYPPSTLILGFSQHALMVGIPIALAQRRWPPAG